VLKEIKEGNKLKKLLMITPTKTENKIINKSSALSIAVEILFEKNEQKD
jgi:hypothetical protein